jgi:hypothetical protein
MPTSEKNSFPHAGRSLLDANSPDAAGKLSVGTAEGYRIVRTRSVKSVKACRTSVDFDRFDGSREALAARSRVWHSKKQKKQTEQMPCLVPKFRGVPLR